MKFSRSGPASAKARLGLAAIAAASLTLVAACAGSGGNTTATAGSGANSITDLVVDVGNEPDSLDPFYRNTAEAQRFYRLAYSSVLKWNEDGSMAPDLATELPQVTDGGLTWTFKLKPGVKFHDGSPLTAKDVVFTYQTATKKENVA